MGNLIMNFMKKLLVIVISCISAAACTTKSQPEDKKETMTLLSDSLSPDGKMKYLKYRMSHSEDSSVFWAIVPATKSGIKPKEKLVPTGYHVQGWTENNELILLKVDTSQLKQLELKDGMILHGVVVKVKK
jgi:hypothetical protein